MRTYQGNHSRSTCKITKRLFNHMPFSDVSINQKRNWQTNIFLEFSWLIDCAHANTCNQVISVTRGCVCMSCIPCMPCITRIRISGEYGQKMANMFINSIYGSRNMKIAVKLIEIMTCLSNSQTYTYESARQDERPHFFMSGVNAHLFYNSPKDINNPSIFLLHKLQLLLQDYDQLPHTQWFLYYFFSYELRRSLY